MSKTSAYIEGLGLIGPGFANWPQAVPVLSGAQAYVHAPAAIPAPAALPSAERRRTSQPVRLALAIGFEAAQASGRDAAALSTVFTASGGDGENCHAICETLAGDEREISPTRFHNSVHNAPAGYWSIAAHAMTSSNVLCAYDGSFCAGLLDSLCAVSVDAQETLLIAFDTEYPDPLRGVRPTADAFGVALVLTPRDSERTEARIDVELTDAPATTLASPALEAVRLGNPAARALPLLEALAAKQARTVVLDYLDDLRLRVDVVPVDARKTLTP